ncbi:MAG: zf-HC2 domain-containing protein [Actinomycetota bacterium]
MDCVAVRDLLAENAVGILPADRRDLLDQHLAWCAGCRKESAHLADGASALGLSLSADPPPDLEDRTVSAVTAAAGRRRRRGPLTAAAVAAAIAVGSLGWAVAMAGRLERLEDQAASARNRAEGTAREFESVLQELGGDAPLVSAALEPEGAGIAGGRAILYHSDTGKDFAVVIVGGLLDDAGPYQAYLLSPSEDRAEVGRLEPTGEGQLAGYRFLAEDVSRYREVVVVDGAGSAVLRGVLAASAGTPPGG